MSQTICMNIQRISILSNLFFIWFYFWLCTFRPSLRLFDLLCCSFKFDVSDADQCGRCTGVLSDCFYRLVDRKPSPLGSYYDGGEVRMPRSPSDHGLDPRTRSPHNNHGNREEELRGRRRPIKDARGRWHSQVRLSVILDFSVTMMTAVMMMIIMIVMMLMHFISSHDSGPPSGPGSGRARLEAAAGGGVSGSLP